MADPSVLLVCVAAQQAVHFVGLPEGNLALAQAVVHLATAPKSNALYAAYSSVQEYLPESLKARRYYELGQQGKEAGIKQWLEKRRAQEQ